MFILPEELLVAEARDFLAKATATPALPPRRRWLALLVIIVDQASGAWMVCHLAGLASARHCLFDTAERTRLRLSRRSLIRQASTRSVRSRSALAPIRFCVFSGHVDQIPLEELFGSNGSLGSICDAHGRCADRRKGAAACLVG